MWGGSRHRLVSAVVAAAAIVATSSHLAVASERTHELVTPPDKNGFDIGTWTGQAFTGLKQQDLQQLQVGWFNVDERGERISYGSVGAFADAVAAPLATQYVATRDAGGWSSRGVNPPYVADNPGLDLDEIPYFAEMSDDFSLSLFRQTPRQAPLTADGVPGQFSFYLRDGAAGGYRLLAGGARTLGDTAEDLSRVTYYPHPYNDDPLWEAYVDDQGVVQHRVVSVVGGQPVKGFAGGGTVLTRQDQRTISRDGRRIVFNDSQLQCSNALSTTTGELPPFTCTNDHVYVREDGQSTRLVSGPAPGAPADPPGPSVLFWEADRDVSAVFFTAQARLTADSTANTDPGDGLSTGSFGDLYRYELDADGGTGRLTDLTVDAGPGGAQVIGVVAVSEDGLRVYFVARSNRLDGLQGVEGEANLYLWDANGARPATTYVATLQAPDSASEMGDAKNWLATATARAAQATPDGGELVFTTKNRLTAYDNDGYAQVYVYSAADGELRCASCFGPQPARGDAFIPQERQFDAAMQTRPGRAVTDAGGRVFFSSAHRLRPDRDANAAVDVYEYDAAANRVELLSGGRSPDPSFLLGSDRSGDDVFFVTRERLASADVDDNVDVYDARVGGGFPAPPHPPQCSGDDCQLPPTPAASDETPGTLASPGERAVDDPPPPARGQIRVRGVRARGSAIVVRASVSGRGRIVATGRRVRTTRLDVTRRGTYTVRVALTPRARRAVSRGDALRVAIRLRFVPARGRAAAAVVRATARARVQR